MFLEGGSESSDERVEASPSLAERARARSRRVRVAEERAKWGVDFGLPELVQVAEEFQDVGPAAAGEGERRPVVAEVLSEGVPVASLLVLVAAESGRRRSGGGRRRGGGGGGGASRGGVDGKACREIWG